MWHVASLFPEGHYKINSIIQIVVLCLIGILNGKTGSVIGSFDGCSGSKKSIFCKTGCQRQWAKRCQINSYFSTELFSRSAYVIFFVTFATKMAYLTYCDKMRQCLI